MKMAVSQSFKNLALSSVMLSINSDSPAKRIHFINYGNGILLYTTESKSDFFIEITQKETETFNESSILLAVYSETVSFLAQSKGEQKELMTVDKSSIGENVGYDPDERVTYWWSNDSNAMTIKYGKGYFMEQTTFMSYTFKDQSGDKDNKNNYFDPTKTKTVKIHDKYPWPKPSPGQPMMGGSNLVPTNAPSYTDLERKIEFSPNPLASNRPAFVRDSSLSTLTDIDLGKYTYSSSLPDACKVLYANVTGENMSLDYGTKVYKFTDAIRHSIEDKDCILYKKLEAKKGEFGPDNEVYLRVTLGKNLGNSPGAPYVLEIWPKKCGSPVHNHGNACAVIRVLHGGLTISIYNKQAKNSSDNLNPRALMSFDVTKNDVTWISPNWYQTHRLYNDTDDFCATIQCYQYGDTDDMHWPYFDYIDPENGHTDNFAPNSDFDFTDMYDKVMKEYEDYIKTTRPLPWYKRKGKVGKK